MARDGDDVLGAEDIGLFENFAADFGEGEAVGGGIEVADELACAGVPFSSSVVIEGKSTSPPCREVRDKGGAPAKSTPAKSTPAKSTPAKSTPAKSTPAGSGIQDSRRPASWMGWKVTPRMQGCCRA